MNVSFTSQDGVTTTLSFTTLLSHKSLTVLYFYPKDNTPGCTRESKDFADMSGEFAKHDCQIIGVSRDSNDSHCEFIKKLWLTFWLISDSNLELHKKFWTRGERSMYGKTYMGTIRSTFLLDKKGTILKERRNIRVPDHVKQVLTTLP